MNRFFLLLCFGMMALGISAQSQYRYFDERYIYTQANIFPQLVNPASFGSNMKHNVMVNYRRKWAGINDTPGTSTILYNGPMVDRLGLGIMVMNDKFGLMEMTKAMAGFSYTIKGDKNQISFGLTGEYIKRGISSVTDPVVITDPKVIAALEGAEYFDATIGIYGVYNKTLTYGLVLPSLVSSRIDGESAANTSDRKIGFIFHAGYDIKASEADVTIKPSIFVKNLDNVPTHLDLNLNASFLKDKITGGITYTIGADNRLGFLVGTNLDKFLLYYSYNTSSNPLQDYNNGSHEISLGISFGGKTKDNM